MVNNIEKSCLVQNQFVYVVVIDTMKLKALYVVIMVIIAKNVANGFLKMMCVGGGRWDDIPYCDRCVTYCERCGHYEVNDEVYDVDGDYICERCINNADDIFECDACGDYHYDRYLTHTEDGYIYCEDCVEHNTFTCPVCEKIYSDEAANYDNETNETYCDYCYDELLDSREDEEDEDEEDDDDDDDEVATA